MARYAVFEITAYYPTGGWDDLILLTDDLEEAVALAEKYREKQYDCAQIVDLETSQKIWDVHTVKINGKYKSVYGMIPDEAEA